MAADDKSSSEITKDQIDDETENESISTTPAQSPPDLGINVSDDTSTGEQFGP